MRTPDPMLVVRELATQGQKWVQNRISRHTEGSRGLWEVDRGTSSDRGTGSHHHVETQKPPDQNREGCLEANRTMSTVLNSAWPQAAPSHSNPPSLSCHSVYDPPTNSIVSLPSSIIQQTLPHQLLCGMTQ